MPMRPDGHYGLSKAFGENLAQFYCDQHGIETVSLRIGPSFPEPVDRRMLATWLSYDDLERRVVASLTAPIVGHSVVHGMGDNTTSWWSNTSAKHSGYRPLDSSERFRVALEARQPRTDPADPVAKFQPLRPCARDRARARRDHVRAADHGRRFRRLRRRLGQAGARPGGAVPRRGARGLCRHFLHVPAVVRFHPGGRAGGPFVESTHGNLKFTAPLTAISAAVVGVILNLALFFAYHVLWPQGFDWPFSIVSALNTVAAAVALFRFKVGAVPMLAACAVAGLLFTLGWPPVST